ncbi:uncharacterized protein V6R79_004571 [Siganus canaliculatus]
MHSLKAFLNERLAAAAEEIFGAVEKTIVEYTEEISRSKDLEISRLKMQLKLLKSEPLDRCLEDQLHEHPHHHPPPPQEQHQHSVPVEDPESHHCEEDGSSSMEEEEHPEPSQIKKEHQKSHRDFWMSHDVDQLESLESDMKDFMSSPSSLRGSLQDSSLPFHLNNSINEERTSTLNLTSR